MSDSIRILGNERNIAYLTEAADSGKLSHAYIIEGAKGSGKKTFAKYFAMRLLCTGKSPCPCGRCSSCVKALSGNHPDLIHITHAKKTVLSIGELREQMISTVQIAPYYGPYKIYIVEDAQLMNANGQNALLKTIEEPPAYVLVFLLTENADAFLDTINSRCVKLNMEPLKRELIISELKRLGIENRTAEEVADISDGNLGQAILLATDTNIAGIRNNLTDYLRNPEAKDAASLAKEAESLNPEERLLFMRLMRMWFRDVLFNKSGLKPDTFYFRSEISAISLQSDLLSYEDISRIFDKISIAQVRLRAQVKADQVMELLLIDVRRVMKDAHKVASGNRVVSGNENFVRNSA